MISQNNQLRQLALDAMRGEELAELEMVSPLFDGEAPKPVHRYLILSTPRSGSYWLCRRLWQAELGLPFEYLNPLHMKHFAKRWGLAMPTAAKRSSHPGRFKASIRQWIPSLGSTVPPPSVEPLKAYLDLLERRRTLSGWFGLKLQPIHLEEWQIDPHRNFQDWHLLPLLRRDQRRQLASYLFSRVSGAYDLGLITSTGSEALSRVMDRDLQQHICERLTWQNRFVVDTARRRGLQPLWLEDLLTCSPESLRSHLQLYLPALATHPLPLREFNRRRDPLHRLKQDFLGKLSAALPASLVATLEQSLAI